MSDESYTMDEALTKMGFGRFQWFAFGFAGLGVFAEAMEVMILSFIGPQLRSEWELSSTQETLLSTVVFAGMLLGAYLWGLVSDNFGRKYVTCLFFNSSCCKILRY